MSRVAPLVPVNMDFGMMHPVTLTTLLSNSLKATSASFAAIPSSSDMSNDMFGYDATADMQRSYSCMTDAGTISPRDIMLSPVADFSGLSSAALTNLTTPDLDQPLPFDESPYLESPELDLAADPQSQWYSLFPEIQPDTSAFQLPQQPAAIFDDEEEAIISEPVALALQEVNALFEKHPAKPVEHPAAKKVRKSNIVSPRQAESPRPSIIAGVSSRKRSAPLPAIIVEDSNDTVAVKRARNTLAARKSREKKNQKMEELCDEINRLNEQVEYWKRKALEAGVEE